MRIKYVGKKDAERDNYVAGTGITWLAGETHDVPDEAAAKLLNHPDVWEAEDHNMAPGATLDPVGGLDGGQPEDTKPPEGDAPPEGDPPVDSTVKGPEYKFVLIKNDTDTVVLDGMTDEEQEAFADAHGIKFDRRLKGDNRRAAIYEAATKE